MAEYAVDILAVSFFVLEWSVYAYTLERTSYGRNSLSARMHAYRERWIRRMLDRDARMVDMQIMMSLQTGTAFFASTTLFAIGGGLALLRATNDALTVLGKLPIDISPTPALWEIKCVGLILIFVYAFFKFAWAYRIFNYVCILLGAMPPAGERDTAKPKRTSSAPPACSNPAGAISTAASAHFSLRSAISAGSSAHGCCS
jgi:uncharacterized membrane protein